MKFQDQTEFVFYLVGLGYSPPQALALWDKCDHSLIDLLQAIFDSK